MEKAVIFDLDGTLLDTLPDIVDNVNQMLDHYGYKRRSLEEISKFIGYGARKLVKDSIGLPLTDDDLDNCLNYYNAVYDNSNNGKTKLFEGMAETLFELKNRGYKLAILTNKPHKTTINVYNTFLKKFNFDLFQGGDIGIKPKPDATQTLKILEKLNVLPTNAYFVGDGETDVLTAINAGVNSIAVLWGYRDKLTLFNNGARVFASNPKEILNLV